MTFHVLLARAKLADVSALQRSAGSTTSCVISLCFFCFHHETADRRRHKGNSHVGNGCDLGTFVRPDNAGYETRKHNSHCRQRTKIHDRVWVPIFRAFITPGVARACGWKYSGQRASKVRINYAIEKKEQKAISRRSREKLNLVLMSKSSKLECSRYLTFNLPNETFIDANGHKYPSV